MERVLSIVALLVCFILVETNAMAADRIVLKKYPELKMGFLNANFTKIWPLGVENVKKSIDFASTQGFGWIEVRDPFATITLAECKALAAYAEQKGVEVAYAMNVALLDSNFWEVFARGLANAAVFKGPRTIRTAAPGLEFVSDPKKTHWTFAEIQKAVRTANQAGNLARMMGLEYVVENGAAALKGDGATTFGMVELFGMANSNLGFELDTGNFFIGSRVYPKPEEAQAFIEKYGSRMGYMHLKTATQDHKMPPVLGDNVLDFDIIFAIAAKNKRPYVAFELDQPATLDQATENHKKSVEYLWRKFGK
jgi:sugar phosphate isomerase/epimerase